MIIIIKTSVSKLEFCQLNSTQVFFSIFGCDKTIIRTDLAREIDYENNWNFLKKKYG